MQKIIKWSLISILYICYFLSTILNSDFWGNLLSPIATLLTAYYILKGYTIKSKHKIFKIFGLLVSLSILNWVIWDCFWAVTEMILKLQPRNLSIFEYGYSLTNVLIFISLLVVSITEVKKWNMLHLFIDAIAVSLSVILLTWVIFFNQKFKNIAIVHTDVIYCITIIINILILIGIVIWCISIRKRSIPLYFIITILGIVIFTIINTIYYYQIFFSDYKANNLLDASYVLSFVIIALGSILKFKRKNPLTCKEVVLNKNRNSIILLFAPIILIIFNRINLEYLLILFLIIIIYFILSGYIQKNSYKNELLKKEKELNEVLEEKVKDRTQKLNYLLNRDMITGLYNRRYFLFQLENMIKACSGSSKIVIYFIEVNKYKMLKTVYGNSIGEAVITQMGNRLQNMEHSNNGPEDNILSIYGEDRFAIAKKGEYDYKNAFTIAEKIIKICSSIYQIDKYDIKLTMNIGLSIYPLDAKNVEEMLKNADWAMIQAENYGYNQAKAFDLQLSEQILKKNIIEMKLKKINYNDEFELYYQPQVLMKNKELIGFEALIRWKINSGKFIPPSVFIPIAEETGSIIPIGDWVLEKVLYQLRTWNKNSNKRVKIAINVSAKQLSSEFIKHLQRVLMKYEIPTNQIEIEITENIQMEANLEIINILQELKGMGITIAIDDFGTGYSSLYYLNTLPVYRLKIAKQLIDRVDKDKYDYTLVKMVIETAKVRGIKVIAEGVETQEQWDCLNELQCDEVQGYLIGKPVPPKEILDNWILS